MTNYALIIVRMQPKQHVYPEYTLFMFFKYLKTLDKSCAILYNINQI